MISGQRSRQSTSLLADPPQASLLFPARAYLHGALNPWQIPLSSLGSPGDQYICWPSRRFIANSSLRYAAEREGLEDCELMFMLRTVLEKRGEETPIVLSRRQGEHLRTTSSAHSLIASSAR